MAFSFHHLTTFVSVLIFTELIVIVSRNVLFRLFSKGLHSRGLRPMTFPCADPFGIGIVLKVLQADSQQCLPEWLLK